MAHVISRLITGCVIVAAALPCLATADDEINLRLTLRDHVTGKLVPGRITIEQRPVGAASVYHFVESLDPEGTAVTYDKARSNSSFEKHTTVSAHPFGANVPPGLYVIYFEHGPEWRGNKAQVWVKEGEVAEQELAISRWIDMNDRGWYSGDTHVHRAIEDLPNLLRAEDLNVALPLSYWVRHAYTPPASEKGSDPLQSDGQQTKQSPGKGLTPFRRLITVDPQRVIWPINTEYELFSVNGQRHTLGAVFVLNHQQPLTLAAPPVSPIAAEARRQGALLDLDKHSWPWSVMLVPIMDVDLFELSNNHIWRTEFAFKQWTLEMKPEGWNIETDNEGFTEWGWLDFGFKTYYALLNCGFKMRPSAGTASGVHPVPLGYGRVYVECPEGFSYENWMQGLDAGRSFVTTGPMLFAHVNDQPPGSTIEVDGPTSVRVTGSVEAIDSVSRIEIVKNGRVVDVIAPQNEYESPWIRRSKFAVDVPVETTSWIAVRCFAEEQIERRHKLTFAHSAPVHIEMPGQSLRPRKVETDYFISRMDEEIARNRDVLRPDELAEYQRARDIYARIAATAIDDQSTTNDQLRSLVTPENRLPDGWELTDISETELQVLGTNPTIISRPDIVGQFPGAEGPEQIEQTNVLRTLLAFYRNPQAGQYAILNAHVCADAASARATAGFLQAPPHRRGRFYGWHRGDLAVGLSASRDMTDAGFEDFKRLIEDRINE